MQEFGYIKLVLFCFMIINKVSGQAGLSSNQIKMHEKSILALPVIFKFPETRWGGGLVSNFSFAFGKDSAEAKHSQFNIGATITQNKQVLIFFPFRIFTRNNKFYFFSENGWYKFNYLYGGIGENRVPDEKFDTKYFRLRLLASKQIRHAIYGGIRINIEDYDVTKTVEGGELSTGKINGSDFSRTMGLGPSVLIDTRDAVFYPTKGIYAEFYSTTSSKLFGANRTFTNLTADVTKYKSLNKDAVLANQILFISNIGDVPFNQLGFLGGQKKMRGLYEGYYRDKNVLLLQSEWRQIVWKRLGVVFFGSVAKLGNEQNFLRFSKPKWSYGAGLRVATKNHLNIRIDYAYSKYNKGNFYATVGEAF